MMNIIKIIIIIILTIGIMVCSYIMINALLISMYHDALVLFMFNIILLAFILSLSLSIRANKTSKQRL